MTEDDRAQSEQDHETLAARPMEKTAPPEPVTVTAPRGPASALVFDAPHSGRHYPEDFGHSADIELLMGGEDRFVDKLFEDAPDHGAHLVAANFARTYIDPNRQPGDIDLELIDGDWAGEVEPSIMSRRGVGLVFRLIGEGASIYDRRLTQDEIAGRIARYWAPYHETLAATLDAVHARFGAVWHLDCHSMQPVGNDLAPDPGQNRADFVLGDLDGASSEPEFTHVVAETLRGLGHSVAINDPYKGALIVERYGRPRERRHSLQIEINRALYLDPETLEKSSGFNALRADMAKLAAALRAFADDRI